MKKISIVIPVYNESASLPKLFAALQPLVDNEITDNRYEWEIVLVNDGSTDNSLVLIMHTVRKDHRFKGVNLSRNFGKENAMLAGLDTATGDAVIIMDADLQNPVSVLPQMITEWENGADDVYGQRTARDNNSWLRERLTMTFYKMLQRLANIDIIPTVGDFRLLDRCCVDALCSMRETQRYTKGMFSWIGFKKVKVEYVHPERKNGRSQFSYRTLFNLAMEGITGFSTAPLRMASLAGIITAICALGYLIYILVKTMMYGDPVAGYPTLMCVMLFLGGCQLIALGIIGEYIARIFIESKHRPPYIIASIYDADMNKI